MKRKSFLQGIIIVLFCLTLANSYGQLYMPGNNSSLRGTAGVVWDAANKRYLISYQDISKDLMGVTTYKSKIYQCGRLGKDTTFFSNLGGQLKAPTGMFISNGKLYIADWTKIWVVSLTDGTVLDQILAPGKARFQDICTDGGTRMYATDNADSKIYWFDLTTKKYDTLAVDTNGVSGPTGIYYEASPIKSVFICSWANGSPIQRYDFSGDSINKFYRMKNTSFKFCYGITGDGKGNYYLSEWLSTAANAGTVYKFEGGWNNVVNLKQLLNFPSDIMYQPLGDTVVIPELNSATKIVKMIAAFRDFIPPICDSATVVNATTIRVHFNEPVNSTASMKINYSGAPDFSSWLTRCRDAPNNWANSSCARCSPMRTSLPSLNEGTP